MWFTLHSKNFFVSPTVWEKEKHMPYFNYYLLFLLPQNILWMANVLRTYCVMVDRISFTTSHAPHNKCEPLLWWRQRLGAVIKRDKCSQPCGRWRGQISPQFSPLACVTYWASIFAMGGTNTLTGGCLSISNEIGYAHRFTCPSAHHWLSLGGTLLRGDTNRRW